MEEFITVVDGIRMKNVHPMDDCIGYICVIHNRTQHHMRDWPLVWRPEKGIFDRTCPHNTGHPDPDQMDFLRKFGKTALARHSCCGCCSPEDQA